MLEQIGKAARLASYELAQLSTEKKNEALWGIATHLLEQSSTLLAANHRDIELAEKQGLSPALLDRLLLTPDRIQNMANDIMNVISLTDPIGEIIEGKKLGNDLTLYRQRVPLGVIGTIYEARPNVTIDVSSLCLKTGNAVILRGGKETLYSNQALVEVIQFALQKVGITPFAVQSINDPDRKLIEQLLRLDRYVDIIIPRGGEGLHRLCREKATIPVLTGGIGVCHIFVDESADQNAALAIIKNAKTQRPSTCNTVETVLIHRSIYIEFLEKFAKEMNQCHVKLHACECSLPVLKQYNVRVGAVTDAELRQEWLSLDLNVVVVDDIEQAICHIREFGSAHSDAILTRLLANAELFTRRVDSAAVYVNASTRFTDGAQFGLGAEVAVSTQKLHARGPMGLESLTTYKWVGYGDNLIRK